MTLTDPSPPNAQPSSGRTAPGHRPERARARRGEGDRLRNEILEAAEALLVERTDPEAVSIRAITDRVGCTAPSVYRHFADKDALLVEVCERAFVHFDEYIQSRTPADADPVEALEACAKAYVHFAMDHPGHYRVLFMSPPVVNLPLTGDGTVDFSEAGLVTLKRLIDQVQAAMDEGFVRGSSAVNVATLLWSIVHGIASLRIAKAEFPWQPVDEQLDELMGILVHGMCGLSDLSDLSTAAVDAGTV